MVNVKEMVKHIESRKPSFKPSAVVMPEMNQENKAKFKINDLNRKVYLRDGFNEFDPDVYYAKPSKNKHVVIPLEHLVSTLTNKIEREIYLRNNLKPNLDGDSDFHIGSKVLEMIINLQDKPQNNYESTYNNFKKQSFSGKGDNGGVKRFASMNLRTPIGKSIVERAKFACEIADNKANWSSKPFLSEYGLLEFNFSEVLDLYSDLSGDTNRAYGLLIESVNNIQSSNSKYIFNKKFLLGKNLTLDDELILKSQIVGDMLLFSNELHNKISHSVHFDAELIENYTNYFTQCYKRAVYQTCVQAFGSPSSDSDLGNLIDKSNKILNYLLPELSHKSNH